MSTAVSAGGFPDYTFTTALDASGNTTDYLFVGNFRKHSLMFNHTGTPTSWVVRVEGSTDASTWFGIDPSNNHNSMDYSGNMTYTTGRPKVIRFAGKFNYIRVFQVSYASTTHSTISTTVKYSGG